MSPSLPSFIDPMLARLGEPFDSDKHLFEWKWDGFRALVFREPAGVRVRSRRNLDLFPRFPDLDFLEVLPPGVIVDGEIIILVDGKPSFERLLQRERTKTGDRIEAMARSSPALYVAFDLLYDGGGSILDRPLTERRARLESVLEKSKSDRLLYSEGVVGAGNALFATALEREFEGVVGKRLNSPYLAGQRTDAWIKFKKSTTIYCVILGYQLDETGVVRSLLVGTDVDGKLACVGRVGSGLTEASRRTLTRMLSTRVRPTPVVPTDLDAIYVEPGVFCVVSYVEKTGGGMLRAPVFKELIAE